MIARSLNSEGFEIVGEASSGPEAVTVAGDVRPDVVILDYVMPGMTGEEAARDLRDVVPGIKIVACSGSVQSKPYWADGWVEKSELTTLPDVLRAVVG